MGLAGGRLLWRSIVVLMVHVVLLSGICHCERDFIGCSFVSVLMSVWLQIAVARAAEAAADVIREGSAAQSARSP
jgi:hypothetical protein